MAALISPENIATSNPFLEIEFGHGGFFLFFRQFVLLAHARPAHQHNADKRNQHTAQRNNSCRCLQQFSEKGAFYYKQAGKSFSEDSGE